MLEKSENDFQQMFKNISISKKRGLIVLNTAQLLHMHIKNQIYIQKLKIGKLELNIHEAS